MTTWCVQYFLLLTLLAGAACLPTSGVKVQRRQTTTSREQCSTLGSCHFYSHCIESKLPCGEEGLVLSYAEKRCRAIHELYTKSPRRTCGSSCVGINALEWAHEIEQCFQERLLALVQDYERHDPIACLGWEHEAVMEMNRCYNQSSDTHIHQLSEEDIKILDSKFRIGGEYYNSMVDRGLPLMIKDRYSVLAAELVRVPPKVRHVYCIKANKYTSSNEVDVSPDDYIWAVKHKLESGDSLPLPNFHYGGMEKRERGNPCTDHEPTGINSRNVNFHLVTLFMENNILEEIVESKQIHFNQSDNSIITGAMYELTSSMSGSMRPPRKITECGDGRRQAMEECDFGGGSAMGCSIDCRVKQHYDCDTTRLQPSMCRLEVCGDGLQTRGEICDDHNNEIGDGCNGHCQVESTTHTCTQSYNRTSSCSRLSLPPVNQIAPNRYSRSSITFKQASSFSSREVVSAHKPSKRLMQPLSPSSAGSRSVSISWVVPCALSVLAASLVR